MSASAREIGSGRGGGRRRGEAAVNIENGLWFVLRGPHAIACASVTNAPPSRVVASPRATRGASSAAAAAGVSVGGGRRQKRPMPKILGEWKPS